MLPDNPRIKIMAATLVADSPDRVHPAQPLYDEARATVATIHSHRSTFLDDIDFEISCPIPGAEIFYTIDGTDPTRGSPRYEGPVTLTESAVVRARAYAEGAEDYFVNEVAFERLEPVAPFEVAHTEPGLRCEYYEGQWGKLPDFEELDAEERFVATAPVIPDLAREVDYALVFTGYVRIDRAGLYDFSIESDDGSKLYVADRLIADNDGLHGAIEITGPIALEVGFYPIAAYMFQRGGDEELQVYVEGPGLEKQPIPPDMLFH